MAEPQHPTDNAASVGADNAAAATQENLTDTDVWTAADVEQLYQNEQQTEADMATSNPLTAVPCNTATAVSQQPVLEPATTAAGFPPAAAPAAATATGDAVPVSPTRMATVAAVVSPEGLLMALPSEALMQLGLTGLPLVALSAATLPQQNLMLSGQQPQQPLYTQQSAAATAPLAAAAAAGASSNNSSRDTAWPYHKYQEAVKKDPRQCPGKLNSRGNRSTSMPHPAAAAAAGTAGTAGTAAAAAAAAAARVEVGEEVDGSCSDQEEAEDKKRTWRRVNMRARTRALEQPAAAVAATAAGDGGDPVTFAAASPVAAAAVGTSSRGGTGTRKRNRASEAGRGRRQQDSRLTIVRAIKAMLGRRGELLYNTLSAKYADSALGLDEAGCNVFLEAVLGLEEWRHPVAEELNDRGIVMYLGRWLSMLTGRFIHPSEVNLCYVSQARQQSYKTNDEWLEQHGLYPWNWPLPVTDEAVSNAQSTPGRDAAADLTLPEMYAVEAAAVEAVRQHDAAAANQLQAALELLRADEAAAAPGNVKRRNVRKEALRNAYLSVLDTQKESAINAAAEATAAAIREAAPVALVSPPAAAAAAVQDDDEAVALSE